MKTKKIIYSLTIVVLLSANHSYGHNGNTASTRTNPIAKTEVAQKHNPQKNDVEVYVCTGPKAKRYHRNTNCSGLNRCSAKIKAYKLNNVPNRYTPCRKCTPSTK